MVTTTFGPSRVQKLQEGYMEPEDEFSMAVENLDNLLTTSRGLIGSLLAMCKAYQEELGPFEDAVDAIREAVDTAATATGAFFEFMSELEDAEGEEEEEEEADTEKDDSEEQSDTEEA